MDSEVREALDAVKQMERPSDRSPSRDGYCRYHTLAPFELRAVRDRLLELADKAGGTEKLNEGGNAEEKLRDDGVSEWVKRQRAHDTLKHYASACEHLLDWAEYDWNWEYILKGAEDRLRNHAERVEAALRSFPEEARCTAVFRRAMRYTTFDPERHEEAWRDYKVSKMVSEERAKFATIPEAWDDPEEVEHRPARRAYDKAGWSGAREGGREEMEALTDAILWARPS